MAIAFDANLGSTDGSGGSTRTFTTTAAAAAAARVVVFVSYFSGSALTGVTIGGTAGALDKRQTNGSDLFDIWSAHISAGLTSGSSVVVTGAISGGYLIGVASLTGIATTAAVVTTNGSNTTAANWSSGAATNTGQANAVYVGGAGTEDATSHTSTPTSGIEIHDRYRVADQQGIATGYKIVSTVASDSVTGTLSNSASTANTGALVIYAAAGGTVDLPAPELTMAPRIPFY